jgi:hypothetical protein
MAMRYLAVVALALGLLSARPLASSQVWGRTAVSSWSASQIDTFLNDSPWAGKALVQRPPGLREYPKHKAIVTWESASLVRQARDRSGQTLKSAQKDDTYMVSVRVWGTAKALENILVSRTALWRDGKPDLAPTRVENYLVNKKGAIVQPLPMRERMNNFGQVILDACGHFKGQESSSSPLGNFDVEIPASAGLDSPADRAGGVWVVRDDLPCDTALVLVFHFPATDAIAPGERVEFTTMVGPQRITRTFQMSKMVVNGILDLR